MKLNRQWENIGVRKIKWKLWIMTQTQIVLYHVRRQDKDTMETVDAHHKTCMFEKKKKTNPYHNMTSLNCESTKNIQKFLNNHHHPTQMMKIVLFKEECVRVCV